MYNTYTPKNWFSLYILHTDLQLDEHARAIKFLGSRECSADIFRDCECLMCVYLI